MTPLSDRLSEARDLLRAHLAAIEAVIADHERLTATAEDLLIIVQKPGKASPAPKPTRKRRRAPGVPPPAGNGHVAPEGRREQARARTLRRIERRQPDLAEQVKEGRISRGLRGLFVHLEGRLAEVEDGRVSASPGRN